jgi:hypothetical protein
MAARKPALPPPRTSTRRIMSVKEDFEEKLEEEALL